MGLATDISLSIFESFFVYQVSYELPRIIYYDDTTCVAYYEKVTNPACSRQQALRSRQAGSIFMSKTLQRLVTR